MNRGSTEVTTRRRKKRDKENKKSIFEIYRSEKTMKDYLFYLNDFLLFVYDNGDPIQKDEVIELMSDITEEDIEDYLSHLLYERNLKKTSVNKIMSALKSLYKELEKYNIQNPLKHIKLFKTGRNLDNILKVSYEDIKNILKNYKVTGEKEYRNILKRDEDYFIKIEKSKSGKELYKPIHPTLVEKLKEFKDYIMKMYGFSSEDMEERFVFSSHYEKNTKLSYKALYNIIQDMGKVVGLDISPHNIRHAIATELSSNGADLLEIRDFLGHSDTRVTEIYINAKSLLDKKVISKIPE